MSDEADQNQSYDTGMDGFFNTTVNQRTVAEANKFRTIPGGSYDVRLKKAEPHYGDNAQFVSSYQRWIVRCGADVYVLNEETGEPRRLGSVLFDLSPEERTYEESGDLDKMSKLWGQAVGALVKRGALKGDEKTGIPEEGLTNKEVIASILETPIRIYVSEHFTVEGDNGRFKNIYVRSDDERSEAKKSGHTLKNGVQTIAVYVEA